MRVALLASGMLGILLTCFAVPGFTQTFGEITGRVTDSSGAAAVGCRRQCDEHQHERRAKYGQQSDWRL